MYKYRAQIPYKQTFKFTNNLQIRHYNGGKIAMKSGFLPITQHYVTCVIVLRNQRKGITALS